MLFTAKKLKRFQNKSNNKELLFAIDYISTRHTAFYYFCVIDAPFLILTTFYGFPKIFEKELANLKIIERRGYKLSDEFCTGNALEKRIKHMSKLI